MRHKRKQYGYIFDHEGEDFQKEELLRKEIERAIIIKKARRNLPQSQHIEEKFKHFITSHQNDGFKTYNRFTEIDTVGKIKLPWER